jgi:hypothetical protein
MTQLGSVVDLNKMSLLGVEVELLEDALNKDGMEGLIKVSDAMELDLKLINNKLANENDRINDLKIEDLDNDDEENETIDNFDVSNHPAFEKITNIIAMSRNFADKKMEKFKNDRGDNAPPQPPPLRTFEQQHIPSSKHDNKQSSTRWGSVSTPISLTQQKVVKNFNNKINKLKITASARRGTYYGMYSQTQVDDLRTRGRTSSTSTNEEQKSSRRIPRPNKVEEFDGIENSRDEDVVGSRNTKTSGIVREGRGWSNVLLRVKERAISPIKKHFTSLKEMDNFIQPDISPRSDNDNIIFHDFDIETGNLWKFKRFRKILSYIRNQAEVYPRNALDGMLPKHAVIESPIHVTHMSQKEYDTIKVSIKRQGGKHNFPLLVSETIAVLELLWSMKDNDDDLFICNPSYWLHTTILQSRLEKKVQKKTNTKLQHISKFTDAIQQLLNTRHGRTVFIHVRDIDDSNGSKQAYIDASKKTSSGDQFSVRNEQTVYEKLVHGYTDIDHARDVLNALQNNDVLQHDAVDDDKNHAMLLNTLRRKAKLKGPVIPFICRHMGSKIQFGLACCRACSIVAYQRYASASSGEYSMETSLNIGETMFKVSLANGKCEEFKPYNLNEISLIFKTMAKQNPHEVHPVYLSHDKQLFWNVIKYFGSCTQALRILFEPAVGNSIIISWAYLGKN